MNSTPSKNTTGGDEGWRVSPPCPHPGLPPVLPLHPASGFVLMVMQRKGLALFLLPADTQTFFCLWTAQNSQRQRILTTPLPATNQHSHRGIMFVTSILGYFPCFSCALLCNMFCYSVWMFDINASRWCRKSLLKAADVRVKSEPAYFNFLCCNTVDCFLPLIGQSIGQ